MLSGSLCFQTLDHRFLEFVDQTWPKGDNTLEEKINSTREALVDWNKNTFGNLYVRKKNILSRLRGTQTYLQTKPTSTFHQDLEISLQNELLAILDQEEMLWRVKSRMDRISEGERNTSFFHRSVTIRRTSNRILSLRDDVGEEIHDQESIRIHVQNFYSNLYTMEHMCNSFTKPLVRDEQDLVSIGYPPTKKEVRTALFGMKPLKAPGPDGFHPVFFQKAWGTIGDDLCSTIQEWYRKGKIPENLCQALICLIPKQPSPETIRQYRPISLCNSIYKLATKILVSRLKPLIPDWISPNQNSFIKGMGADINLVVATEVLHSMHKKKGKWGWFALKIDLEKAYDRVEWGFVRECLISCNLDLHSINLIMNCVSQASSSVLVNGRKTLPFQHSRGLRQGDPMSPYLFNICLEALSKSIHTSCDTKEWTPFWVGRKKVPISHLLFADDLLLFGRVDENTAFSVRDTLLKFCAVSGQKINELKSKLTFSPNTSIEYKQLFQETIHVNENNSLGTYLGLPLSHKRPSRTQVQFVIEKVRNKLAKWKTRFLSKAGRLCLIKSTLSTIPAYYMQATLLPSATLKELDSVCNNFLWGGTNEKKKIHLVGKDHTFQPRNRGGLGIREQEKMNRAYMAKLGWKVSQAP